MFRRHIFIALGLSLLGVATFACSGDDEDAAPPTTNGVNDVVQACAIRAQWTQASSLNCNDCLGVASVAKCDCTASKEYAGRCFTQQDAKTKEPACAGVGECVFKCAANDCACVDACYANNDACRVRAAALDGCLAEICDASCR